MNGNDSAHLLEVDALTAQRLARLAEMWGISEEEAVRRAVAQVNNSSTAANKERRLESFKQLQRSLSLTPAKAAEWQDAIRDARR